MVIIIKFKRLLLIALLPILLLTITCAPTHAATWHRGTPTVLRGHWKTKTWRPYKQYKMTGHAYLKVHQTWFTNSPALPPLDPSSVMKVYYKKVGHVYHLVGRDFNNAPAGGIKVSYRIKVYNRHKIYFKQLHQLRKDINHTYYKY